MSRPPFSQHSEGNREVAARSGEVESTSTYSAGIENNGAMDRVLSIKDWQQSGVHIESIEGLAFRSETLSLGSDPTGEPFDPNQVEYRLMVGVEDDSSGNIEDPRIEKVWTVDQLPADFSQTVFVNTDESIELYARWHDTANAAAGDPMRALASLTYRVDK